MGLRERLARLEEHVHTPRRLAAQRAEMRTIAMASEAALYTVGESVPVQPATNPASAPPLAPPPPPPQQLDPNQMVAVQRDGRTMTVPRRTAEAWERDRLTITP